MIITTKAETNDKKSGAKPRYDQRIVRLYRVNLRGFRGTPVGSSYVVADNPDEACRRVRDELDRRDYGFNKDRELESIELLAESKQYTDTPAELFLPTLIRTERQTMIAKVLNWIMTGKVGMSSKAMAAHLFGAPCDGSYPHDPDDFNRCLLFLDAVPEARAELQRMAEVNTIWAALVARWDEIESSFLAEAGRDWCRAKSARNTYRLMRDVIDKANTQGEARGARKEKPHE